ncbi:MAG: hypothetical protein AAFN63_14300 [Pseudomonadota bacterium]
MRIVRNTPEQLILRALPPIEGVWIILLFIILSGSLILALITGPYDIAIPALALITLFVGYHLSRLINIDIISLDRRDDTLEIRRYSLLGRDRVRHPLGDLGHATIDLRDAPLLKRQKLALVLDKGMDAGKHIITRNHYLGQGARTAADTINDWLTQDVDSDTRPA